MTDDDDCIMDPARRMTAPWLAAMAERYPDDEATSILLPEAEYHQAFSNLCDALGHALWPERYELDPNDPERHTSEPARLLAGVLFQAIGVQDAASWITGLLTRDQVLEVLSSLGHEVQAGTWSSYVTRGKAPRPVQHFGRTPLWSRADVQAWANFRPGRGARTDLQREDRDDD